MKNFIIILFIFSFLSFNLFPIVSKANTDKNDYSMPFASNELWTTNGFQGVHSTGLGFGIDLFPSATSKKEVYALSNGKVSTVCTVNEASTIRLITDKQDIFHYSFLNTDSLIVKAGQEIIVKKGDKLGSLVKKGDYKGEKCDLSTPEENLMLSWEKKNCNLKIQEYEFSCDDMKQCPSGNLCNYKNINQTFKSNLNEVISDTNCATLLNQDYNIGESGAKIFNLQKCLKDLGLFNYVNGLTGYFGTYTQQILNKHKNIEQKKLANEDCNNTLSQYYYYKESGPRISKLQECLKKENYYNFANGITGYFGDYTQNSYNNFLNGSPKVCDILKKAIYNLGETSPRVKRLQQCLRDAKLFDFPTNTGFFGTITQKALKKWQSN
jgi:hypothetical protein